MKLMCAAFPLSPTKGRDSGQVLPQFIDPVSHLAKIAHHYKLKKKKIII